MAVSDTFTVLGDPTRRQIVAFLADGEYPAGEIAEQFNISAPAISQHLKTLKASGLVNMRPNRQQRLYSVNQKALGEAAVWLMKMGGFWDERVAAMNAATGDVASQS
jgi:DNA-binding transcriptional ArsR family regulator